MRWTSTFHAADLIGTTPLMRAVDRGRPAFVMRFLEAGADVQAATREGATALFFAARRGAPSIARALLDAGAQVNRRTPHSGRSPLIVAAEHGRVEVLRLLIEAGADVNGADKMGLTPLIVAAEAGHLDVAQALVDAGADPNVVSRRVGSALTAAAFQGHAGVVRILIDAGAKVDPPDGSPALLAASMSGSMPAVRLLIDNGADVNARGRDGTTPLFAAALRRRADVAHLLLEHGADAKLRDDEGRTPLDYAVRAASFGVMKLLYHDARAKSRRPAGVDRSEPGPKAAPPSEPGADAPQADDLLAVVREAFLATHDGYSTDEVLLDDNLNARFLERCRASWPEADAETCNWTLLKLRKSADLGPVVTRRRPVRHDEGLHAAEIAARLMHDTHGLSMDRFLCRPERRAEFDRIAASMVPAAVSPYELRKAALRLRKSRRLRPELVLRVADWSRLIRNVSADDVLEDPDVVPDRPGVYIFRDGSGYLYIGESANLRNRVTAHLDRSDRGTLAAYLWERGARDITVELHAFDPESRAKERRVRSAYESELIRSRKPRFNVRP